VFQNILVIPLFLFILDLCALLLITVHIKRYAFNT
jgi:hypothetical protein